MIRRLAPCILAVPLFAACDKLRDVVPAMDDGGSANASGPPGFHRMAGAITRKMKEAGLDDPPP